MPIQVLMPQLGESVNEGKITKWLKAVGETVKENEPLVEINTDKVDTEVPCPASGVLLEIIVPEGAVVQKGGVMAVIGMPGEQAVAAQPAPGAGAPAPAPQPAPPQALAAPALKAGRSSELGFISPVVAKLAGEYQLDLARVNGTGQGGRITKQDVLQFIEQQKNAPPPQPPTAPAPLPPKVGEAGLPTLSLPGDELLPHTSLRRSIAEHMVLSERTSPHVTTVMEADLSRVIAHREANKAAFAKDGVNLTFTAYFVAAAAAALKAHPVVNASWSDSALILHRQVNIGMATSLSAEGLIVPVIKGADRLSLLGLAQTINDLAGRARARKLTPNEVHGGTFTITNHGIGGSLFAAPIINQPQCGILGVGAIQKRAVVISDALGGDAIAIRPMVYLSLTFDHRILDGAAADGFLAKVVESLNHWAN